MTDENDYEVVWQGSMWRDIQTVSPALEPDKRQRLSASSTKDRIRLRRRSPRHYSRAARIQTAVLDCLCDESMTAPEIAARAKLNIDQVRHAVIQLQNKHKLICVHGANPRPFVSTVQYRQAP